MIRSALVVGAGIGGLAAARALQQAGWEVRVFEKAASPRELGFALNLAPNAMAALRELGAADIVKRDGHSPRVAELRGEGGRLLRRLDARMMMADSVVAMRPVVHGALLDAVGMAHLSLSSAAVGFEADDRQVTLRLSDGRTEAGDILVGADGIASVIRQQLHPDHPPARPSGYWAMRGTVEDIKNRLGGLDGVLYYVPRVEAAVIRAGATSAYWYMSLVAEEIPPGVNDARAICERFTGRLDHTFHRVVDATRSSDMRVDELFTRKPLQRWGRGRVTLLGDAAHPMLPHTGQGAAQAMEDAVALGLALRNIANEGIVNGLRRYEEVRAARTQRFVAAGPRIARVTTSRSVLVSGLRNAVVRFAPTGLVIKALQTMDSRDPHAALRNA